jgi:hypothetical protein
LRKQREATKISGQDSRINRINRNTENNYRQISFIRHFIQCSFALTAYTAFPNLIALSAVPTMSIYGTIVNVILFSGNQWTQG